MRPKISLFCSLLAFLIIGFTYNMALAGMTDFRTDVDDEGVWEAPSELKYFSKSPLNPGRETLLNPGMSVPCAKTFSARNTGDTVAEFELITGDKLSREEIQPEAVQSYNLMSGSGAEQEAHIFNSGDLPIVVECK